MTTKQWTAIVQSRRSSWPSLHSPHLTAMAGTQQRSRTRPSAATTAARTSVRETKTVTWRLSKVSRPGLRPTSSKQRAKLPTSRLHRKGHGHFYVVRTAPIGLKVRSTNEREATQLGGIANLNVAWAWCQQTSDFDPDPGDNVPGLWLQIAWDHQEPNTTDYFQSEPGADGWAWIYAGFTVPSGHSGDIPRC